MYFTFNGQQSGAFKLVVAGAKANTAAEHSFTRITVPGRNGDIFIDNGSYKNITVSYDIALYKYGPVEYTELAKWLLSPTTYVKLEDSEQPSYFRMGMFSGDLAATVNALNKKGKATLKFNCRPERYIKTTHNPPYTNIDQVTMNAYGIGKWEFFLQFTTYEASDFLMGPTHPRVVLEIGQAADLPADHFHVVLTTEVGLDTTTHCDLDFSPAGIAKVAGKTLEIDFDKMAIRIDGTPAVSSDFNTLIFNRLNLNEAYHSTSILYLEKGWADASSYPDAITSGVMYTNAWTL